QRFGVAQIKFVREYPDMLLMRLVNDGLIDRGLYFSAVTQPVVHPHFHIVGVIRGKFADVRAGFLRILRAITMVRGVRFACVFEETVARGKHARATYSSGMLSITHTVNRVLVLS